VDLWIIIGLWVLCGIACLLVARSRGVMNPTSWLVLGTLLGPFGVILALMDARPPKHEYTMEALNRLGDLRAQGVLSDAEYEAKRKDLLGRM
jgi:Short C-terminal domain